MSLMPKWLDRVLRNRQRRKANRIYDRLLRKDVEEKRRIAHHFNARYAYCTPYVNEEGKIGPGVGVFGIPYGRGYRWMCPACNRIHAPYSASNFTGLQYPACCGYRSGHRWGGWTDKLPNNVAYDKKPHHCISNGLQRPYADPEKGGALMECITAI